MKKINFSKQLLPHIAAVFIFLFISTVLYYPIILENKTLIQNDINQGGGASAEITKYREKLNREILWTNSMFSGMPSYFINVRWSGGAFLNIVQDVLTLHLPRTVKENFLAFITFYILLLVFGVRPWLAIGGALAYGLSTFYVISIFAGHMWKVRAIAYMPLVIAGIHSVFSGKKKTGFILTAFALALELHANHLQITYYLLLLVLLYGIFQLWDAVKQKQLRDFGIKTGILLIAAILALGINLGRIWTTLEYGKYSIRGKSEITSPAGHVSGGLDRDYAFSWSSGKWESMTMLIPNLYGGASGKHALKSSELSKVLRQNNIPANQISQYEAGTLGYWGTQPGTAGPVYVGAIIFFLFVMALFFVDKKYVWWLILATAFSVILSWGKNFESFNYFMFDHFPGYNKFRAVTMTIVIAMLTMPLLGFMGLEKVLQLKWTKAITKKMFIALGITAGLALLIAMFANPPLLEGNQIPAWFRDAVDADRKYIIRMDAFRSLFFVLVVFIGIYLFKIRKLSEPVFIAAITLFITLDLGMVDARYFSKNDFVRKSRNHFFAETDADKRILEDKDLSYRVFSLQNPFNEARTSIYHKSIGGYHGAKIRRYQDVISRYLGPEHDRIIQDKGINAQNTKILSMLNARYIYAGNQRNAVFRNPFAQGNAWFVADVMPVRSPDEEIKSLSSADLKRTAIIDQSKFDVPAGIGTDSLANITLTEYEPDYMKYVSDNVAKGLAVFSEVFYPVGWVATVDGKEAKPLRANYILRALEVPAGRHTIEFTFKPDSYYIGNKITFITSLIYGIIFFAGLFRIYQELKITPEEGEV